MAAMRYSMEGWMLEAELDTKAAMKSLSFDSTFVKTVVIFNAVLKNYVKWALRATRVEKWGEDGLLFLSRDESYFESSLLIKSVFSMHMPSLSTLHISMSWDNLEPSNAPPPNVGLLRKAVCDQCGTGSLQSLSIEADLFEEPSFLMPFLTSTTCSLQSLTLICNESFCLLSDSVCIALTENTIPCIHSFSLVDGGHLRIFMDCEMLGRMLVHNTSLTSFTLFSIELTEAQIRHLFNSLKKNRHLTCFSVAHCKCSSSSWPIASVLDCLQVNTTLCEVDFTGTPLENDNAIRAQLSRNKENVKLQRVLRSRLVRPTTVRLFLCGLPYSGKTRLSRSLANWNNKASWLSRRARSISRLKRTRGIEVTILEKEVGDQHQRILLWDMAGHIEFHSFHDSMFPDLSSRATPSMFLFVWNPFEIDTEGNILLDSQGQRRRKVDHKFRVEFKYWLRFIASKTLKSEIFKPKVLVAITRADLVGLEDIKAWFMSDFTVLQEEFREVIQFDEDGFFFLNAKDHLQAGQVGSHVFDCAKAILKDLPDVYQVCAEARELFGSMVHDKQIPPLITKVKFHQLCEEELRLDSREMREAVALSLNNSGDLIYFKSLELVVLDTQWFCHSIMGDLLNAIITSKTRDVFFPASALEALIEGIMNSMAAGISKLVKIRAYKTFESMKVAGCDLVKLLVGLRLACLEDIAKNNSRIFFAISLSGKAKRTIFPKDFLVGHPTYVGRRLTCKELMCTFLTPGLFPFLQVTFHKILHDREVLVQLEEDVMAFAVGGVKVFIEFCRLEGEDHFIDILVCSSRDLDETLEWLQRNVIFDVESVCAEPRGAQGVELAHAIIQPACIEKFFEARRRPAVLLTKLQDVLKNHVEMKGVNDGIKAVMYTWQTTSFPADSVVDLLGGAETAKVIQTYLCGLSDAEREISNLFVEEAGTSQPQKPSAPNVFVEEVGTSQPQKPQFGTSPSSKEREILFNQSCEVMRDLKNVMRDLKKLGHAVEDLRNAVLSKLHELFTFVKEGEAGKLPRRFVVTKDGGIVRRVVSAIVPSLQNMRLQLLCECRSESCHLVDGKEGLSLATLDDGLLKRGLPYINAFLKVAYVVARVGAHVAVGFGDIIPDFTRVLANIVDAPICDGVPGFNNLTDDWNSSSRVDFQAGQQWLFDVLSNRDCIKGDQIYAIFGLRRVRFNDSRAAWVCDKHYQEGTPWPA